MSKRLINVIEKRGILSDSQFAFRSTHSTVQTILLIIDKITKREWKTNTFHVKSF